MISPFHAYSLVWRVVAEEGQSGGHFKVSECVWFDVVTSITPFFLSWCNGLYINVVSLGNV